MPDQTLNPGNWSQTPNQSPDQISADQILDQRIARALEAAPAIHIPVDFDARVAAQLPDRRPVSLTPTRYGQSALLIGLVATFAALVILAIGARGHAPFGLLESLLFAQFLALAVWFTVWRHSLR